MRSLLHLGIGLALVLMLLGSASPLIADDWGTLSGRFVFEGDIPEAAALRVTTDAEFCGPFGLVDESLVVNPDNRGIANIVVFLYLSSSDTPPEAHPDYAESAEANVVLDNNQCRFSPRISIVRTSQTLVLGNQDRVAHNSNIAAVNSRQINPLIAPGRTVEHQFSAIERLPIKINCAIHPWMAGYIVVKDHPYVAVTDADGHFEIPNLPVGERTIQVWHERSGYVSEVDLGNGAEEWRRGRFDHTVVEGENDIGEVKVDAGLFER